MLVSLAQPPARQPGLSQDKPQCTSHLSLSACTFAVSLQRSQMASDQSSGQCMVSESIDMQHQQFLEAVIYHLTFSCKDLQPPCLNGHGLLKSSIRASVFRKIWVKQLQHSRILNSANCTQMLLKSIDGTQHQLKTKRKTAVEARLGWCMLLSFDMPLCR